MACVVADQVLLTQPVLSDVGFSKVRSSQEESIAPRGFNHVLVSRAFAASFKAETAEFGNRRCTAAEFAVCSSSQQAGGVVDAKLPSADAAR